MSPREDIYAEVLRAAKAKGFPVIGSPFESDHQLVACDNQRIVDFVISTDTDMPFLGIRRTIYSLPLITRWKVQDACF